MSISIATSHKCIERSTDCDCPICGDYMFASPKTVVFMPCGHSIHHTCYYDHMKTSYKCPICSKSIVNMETQFRNLDRAIESQPMPSQFQGTKALVSCNDCYAKTTVNYHWLGLKCGVCDSYNTTERHILSDPDVEAPVPTPVQATEMSPADLAPRDRRGSLPVGASFPGPGPARHQRHSVQLRSAVTNVHTDGPRYRPYQLYQRLGRSASPPATIGLSENLNMVDVGSNNELQRSESEGGFQIFGRDWHRIVSYAGSHNDDDEEYEDDSASEVDEGDEDEDEGDNFDAMELFGHR